MTPRQLEVLDYVREAITVAGVCPSVRDVGKRFGMSTSQAWEAIDALVTAGALERGPGRTRNLLIAGQPDVRTAPTHVMVAELRRRGVEVLERRQLAVGRFARTCAADTCGEPVKVGMLMCRRHWFMLSESLQQGLKRASAAGETARFQALLATAKDVADGLTPEMRAKRA
jgi:hypothetical protein